MLIALIEVMAEVPDKVNEELIVWDILPVPLNAEPTVKLLLFDIDTPFIVTLGIENTPVSDWKLVSKV